MGLGTGKREQKIMSHTGQRREDRRKKDREQRTGRRQVETWKRTEVRTGQEEERKRQRTEGRKRHGAGDRTRGKRTEWGQEEE